MKFPVIPEAEAPDSGRPNLSVEIMAQRIKIPVVKNRLQLPQKQKSRQGARTRYIILVFVIMLLFVWLRVQTNVLLTDIKSLEDSLREHSNENSQLETKVKTLSDYNRIVEIARSRLGMEKISNDKIIRIKEEE